MNDIKTPEELLNFMSNNINYGYLGKNGRIYKWDDSDFDSSWYDEYILESYDDLLNTLTGNCWDQVEFERKWFLDNHYEIKTIYEMVRLDYENNYPSHSFLVYKDDLGKWNWFENSDFDNRGIHSFDTLDELLNYQYNTYLKLLNRYHIKDEEINKIVITEFNKPNKNCTAKEYINQALNSKKIEINKDSSKMLR